MHSSHTLLRILPTLLLAAGTAAAWADVVVLRNGARIEGTIESEDATEVRIWRTFRDSKIRYIEKIPRRNITRVERQAPAPQPDNSPSNQAPAPAAPVIDKRAKLEEALEKYTQRKYPAAGLDLTTLINSSTPAEIQAMSGVAIRKTRLSLAEVAADAHLETAIARDPDATLQVPYVTEYEKPVLLKRLIEEYQAAMTEPVSPDAKGLDRPQRKSPRKPARKAASRPAGAATQPGDDEPEEEDLDDRSLAAWLSDPEGFEGQDRKLAAAMVRRAEFAMGLLSERMRLDPAVRRDERTRRQLLDEKRQLNALLDVLRARAAGRLTAKERAAERIAKKEELARQRQMLMRQWQQRQYEQSQHTLRTLRELGVDPDALGSYPAP